MTSGLLYSMPISPSPSYVNATATMVSPQSTVASSTVSSPLSARSASSYSPSLSYASDDGATGPFSSLSKRTCSREPDAYNSIDDMKSEIDVYRQRGANMRALSLLNEVNVSEKQIKDYTSRQHASVPETTRQAAQKRYEERQKIKMEIKAKLKQDRMMYQPPPKLVVIRQEKLAETTRKIRPKTADDVRDPETVSGMKCQLDWDREKEAQAKALKMLNQGIFLS